jgi:predicted DNA-binding transcriptional regulator YafY
MTGPELVQWMRERDLTVALLAARLEVGERSVYRWRASARVPRVVELAIRALC